ncbi:MAG TPA: capsule biosynthesis protein [Novosphingobium capsulatum]|nr:capsule biosynthesis protein [Novosphingobium capsulatum]
MSLRKFREGWRIQGRVIHALMIRELHTRYGRENIGFLWIMVEPMLFAGLVAILWRVTRGSEEHGVGIVAFTVTGYLPVVLFRHAVSRCVALFVANSSLMYHQQIKILDFILVRVIIELLGSMMAYFFIAAILIGFGQFPVPYDIGLMLGGWGLYAFFTFSLCLIIAPLSEMSELVEKLIPVTTYIMLPFSGLFTMASWLAPKAREYLLWSPFVNAMEMMRKGVFGDRVTAYYDIWNPIVCSVVLSAIGLALCRHVRKTIAVE